MRLVRVDKHGFVQEPPLKKKRNRIDEDHKIATEELPAEIPAEESPADDSAPEMSAEATSETDDETTDATADVSAEQPDGALDIADEVTTDSEDGPELSSD